MKQIGQYLGLMHAGVVGALIDTAFGYAAATVAGPKLSASHFGVLVATGETLLVLVAK